MGARENNLQKLQFHKMKSYLKRFYLSFSQFLRNLKFIFSGSHRNLLFGVISCNSLQMNISSP